MSRATKAQTPDQRAVKADTLPQQLLQLARQEPDRLALRYKDLGIWKTLTRAQYLDHVHTVGAGLIALGLTPGGRVAIQSENRVEWVFFDLGAQGAAGVSVGVYPTSPPAELAHVLRETGATFLVAEDQEQVDKALAVADECPTLRTIIYLDPRGIGDYTDPRLTTLDDVMTRGRDEEFRRKWLERAEGRFAEEPATIVFTSGTIGPAKGAVQSHRALIALLDVTREAYGMRADDEILSYLPLSHVAEKHFTLLAPLSVGATVSFAESFDTLQENLQEVLPTVFVGVPRVWEKMQATVHLRMRAATPIMQAVYAWAMRRADRATDQVLQQGGSRRFRDQIRFFLPWLLVTRAIRHRLGLSRVRVAISGSAPISPEILRFFISLGVPVVEAYGQTECGGIATMTRPGEVLLGSVGPPVSGVEVKLDEDSEILVHGRHLFSGYFGHPELDEEVFTVDGWVRTGDLGEWDDNGRLRIIGRKKDIFITAGGKNVSPSFIENTLKASPYIREAIVVGDGRRYLVALIGIDLETVGDWLSRSGLPYTTYRDLTTKPQVRELIEDVVLRANRDLSSVEQIKQFALLPKELDADDEELTHTQKVKRSVVTAEFSTLVESLYEDAR